MRECVSCHRFAEDSQAVCPHDGGTLVSLLSGSPVLDDTYELHRRLGSGGVGWVALAEHLGLHRKVAVKLLRPDRSLDPTVQARFRREAEALGRLQHPNIVDVTDFGVDPRDGGVPYLVTKLLDGRTLRQRLTDQGPLDLAEAVPIIDQIAAALDHAHGQGILHRDLKPENIFLTEQGGGVQVRIVDFGLARLLDGQTQQAPCRPADGVAEPAVVEPTERNKTSDLLTHPGTLHGTAGYLAPEVLDGGSAGKPADLYAFGVVIYEMLTGCRPFSGSVMDLVVASLQLEPTAPSSVNPDLSPLLDPVLLRTLCKDPTARPANAAAIAAAIREAELRVRQERWLRRARPRRMRTATLVAVIALLLPVVLGLLGQLQRVRQDLVRRFFSVTRPRPPDPRLLLVVFDEASFQQGGAFSQRTDEVSSTLRRVLDAGALAVGIDVQLPESWSLSPAFTGLLARHHERLVLALSVLPDRSYSGDGVIAGPVSLALGPQRSARMLGIVNVDTDPDGRVFKLRTAYACEDGSQRPTFPARLAEIAIGRPAAEAGRALWIDYSVAAGSLPRVAWHELPALVRDHPQQLEGRIVLVGQELTGIGDVYRGLPHPAGGSGRMTGVMLLALMTNTLLTGGVVREAPRAFSWILSGLVAWGLSAGIFASRRPRWVVVVACALAVMTAAVAVVLFRRWLLVLPVIEVLVPPVVVLAGRALLRGRLQSYPTRLLAGPLPSPDVTG